MRLFSKRMVVVMAVIMLGSSILIINPIGIINPLRSVFFSVSAPFQKITYSLGLKIRNIKEFISSIHLLKIENENLRQQVAAMEGEIVTLQDIKMENENMRSELSLAPQDEYQLLPALVVSQDPQGLGSWIMINQGDQDGVKVGMPVVVAQRLMVGRVEEVFAYNSKVTLIMSPESSINGVVSAGEARGIVKGEYGLGAVFDMVLQSDTLEKGNSVITSGIGGEMPRGLLLGKIQEVRRAAGQLYQQAILTFPIKTSSLHLVFVITAF